MTDAGTTETRQCSAAYRHRVGAIMVSAVNDGHNRMPLREGFVRDITLGEMQAALTEAHLPTDSLTIPFTPLVVETGGETVLFDTGYGGKGPSTAGMLIDNLAAAGFSPSDITRVALSHFHGDHINGLLDAQDRPVFPEATISVPAKEWAFWTSAEARGQAPESQQANFANVERVLGSMRDRLEIFEWNGEVAPGITALEAAGHTPGMTIFDIRSEGDRLVFIADVVNHPAFFVRHPNWAAVFDMDPEQARATRHRVLDMLADSGALCAGFHVPFPSLGHIERDGHRYRHVPIQWMAAV